MYKTTVTSDQFRLNMIMIQGLTGIYYVIIDSNPLAYQIPIPLLTLFAIYSDIFKSTSFLFYIDNLFEILYPKPIATKRVMIPADIVIIKFVLIT
jgi:hypothetical protein